MSIEDQISNDTGSTKNRKQVDFFEELFGKTDSKDITIEDMVLALNKLSSQTQLLGKVFDVVTERSAEIDKIGRDTSAKVQELSEKFNEFRDKTMKAPRPMDNPIINTDELIEEVLVKLKDDSKDYNLDLKIKKQMKKYNRRSYFLILMLILSLIANFLPPETFKNLFAIKTFTDTEVVQEVNNEGKPKKTTKAKTKFYIVPVKAEFRCDGIEGTYKLPKLVRTSKAKITSEGLKFPLNNKGKTFTCYTKEYKEE